MTRLALIDQLGLPGVIDVHSHFMPEPVMAAVWRYFDDAGRNYGVEWPIEYRAEPQERLSTIRELGVIQFSSMIYAHRPNMAAGLNRWAESFAAQNSDCIQTATFFPEDAVLDEVERTIAAGARLFKVHLQVGAFDPRDERLQPVWQVLQEHGLPVVVHCGSGPIPGEFTGPGPISEVLERFADLALIVAHMGAPEYAEFLELARRYPNVRLDTTMAFTDFMNRLAVFPDDLREQVYQAGLRGDVLWGSDFPNIPYSYAEAVDALVRLDLGDDWLRAVLHDNAAQLFGSAR